MGYRVQARLGVQAPAFAVWDVLSNLDGWKDWNPLVTEAEGQLLIGKTLHLRRVRHDGVGEAEDVRVVDWVPNEQILWIRKIGLFARVLAFLEIEAVSPTGCILSVGEVYDGLIGTQIGKSRRRVLNKQWTTMAEALKTKAEATWDGTPGESVLPPPPPPKAKKRPVMAGPQMALMGRPKK